MGIIDILLAIILPPVAVALRFGATAKFWINLLLTLLVWIPGIIHALYILSKKYPEQGIEGVGV
jgi:uncharacterized membrane protein YqaE (UPF0057 family)